MIIRKTLEMRKPFASKFIQSWRLRSLFSFVILVLFFFLNAHSFVSLLDEGVFDTFSLWNRDCWGLAVTDDEDVGQSGGELLTTDVFNVSDIERTWMLLNGFHDTDSANVVSSGEHNSGAVLELDDSLDFSLSEVDL